MMVFFVKWDAFLTEKLSIQILVVQICRIFVKWDAFLTEKLSIQIIMV